MGLRRVFIAGLNDYWWTCTPNYSEVRNHHAGGGGVLCPAVRIIPDHPRIQKNLNHPNHHWLVTVVVSSQNLGKMNKSWGSVKWKTQPATLTTFNTLTDVSQGFFNWSLFWGLCPHPTVELGWGGWVGWWEYSNGWERCWSVLEVMTFSYNVKDIRFSDFQ